MVEKAAAFMMAASKKLFSEDISRRGIIFVRTKDQGAALKTLFQHIDFIHGEVTDESVRAEMIRKWKTGQSGGWIIGTTSLIQGVDYPNVHLVIFLDAAWGMIDFVQGAGRGGRNGHLTRVVMIHADWIPTVRGFDTVCAAEMRGWIQNTKDCRRVGISRCMDEVETTCGSLEGAVHCDMCLPDSLLQQVFQTANPLHPQGDADMLSQVLLAPPTHSPTDPRPQLTIPMLRPQPARAAVIRTAAKAIETEAARESNAKRCITNLEEFGDNCAICHARNNGVMTGVQHKMCFKESGCSPELESFYDHNKPRKGGQDVGDHKGYPLASVD